MVVGALSIESPAAAIPTPTSAIAIEKTIAALSIPAIYWKTIATLNKSNNIIFTNWKFLEYLQ